MTGAASTSGGRVRVHLAVPLFRNAYALVATTAITSALGVAYWGLATQHYSAVEVGRATAAISTLMLLAGITQLNLVNVLPRFLPQAGARSGRMILGAYGAASVAAVVVAGAYVATGRADEVLAVDSSPWAIRLAFVGAVVGWNLFTLQDGALAGLREAVWVPLENAVFAVVKIVLLVALASSLPTRGALVSWTVPSIVAVLPVTWLIFVRLLPRHVSDTAHRAALPERREFVRYVAGDYVGGLFQLALVTVPPLVVVSVLGLEANAYFATAWIVAGAFDLVLANIGVSLTVEGATDEARLPHLARSVARLSLALAVPAAAVIVVVAPFLLSLLGSEYRAEGVTVLRYLAVAMPFRAVTVLYLSLARVRRRIGALVGVQALSCVLVLGIGRVLLDRWGISGMSAAYFVSQVAVAALVAVPVWSTLRSASGPPHPHGDLVAVTEAAIVDSVAR